MAMSGGVDSSVAACLLADQGYEVLGSHMRLVHLEGVEHGCCGPLARADAETVARIGGFGFEVADMSAEFEDAVIDDFLSEQGSGRTPNPCARCNGEIKFGAFLRRADELGIDAVATGHYVRSRREPGGAWRLLRGPDQAKDQSYMLHMLGQRAARPVVVPGRRSVEGGDESPRGRFGLPVGDEARLAGTLLRPERRRWRLRAVARPRPGPRRGRSGRRRRPRCRRARRHVRLHRRPAPGLGVAMGTPAYVVEIDAPRNRVVVGPAELLSRRRLRADRASWVAGSARLRTVRGERAHALARRRRSGRGRGARRRAAL